MKRILFIFLSLVGGLSNYAQTYLNFGTHATSSEWLTPTREVTQESNLIKVDYQFGNAQVITLSGNGIDYTLLRIKGFSDNGIAGQPSLPTYQDIIAVPSKDDLSVEILDTKYVEFANYNIYPAQPQTVDGDTIALPFQRNAAVYATNSFMPSEVVKINEVQEYRRVFLAYVNVSPIQYNPATKRIRCYTKITYRINYKGNYLMHMMSNLERSTLKNIVTNKDVPIVSYNNPVADPNYSVIVTTDKYLPAVNYFAEWKNKTGFKTKVISKASWKSADVKSFLKREYGTLLATGRLKYILIVGDAEDVPGEYITEGYEPHYTDLYYACFGGADDYTPDVAYGRIPVNTLEEAYTVFNKIMSYQMTPSEDLAFYRKGVHCAFFQTNENAAVQTRTNAKYVETVEKVRDYMVSKNYNIERIYNKPKNANPEFYLDGTSLPKDLLMPTFEWNGNVYNIINALNKGCFYILHRDHGDINKWRDPGFDLEYMDLLADNNGKQPVVFSINCLTGKYDVKDGLCFAEKLLRMPKKGAVGVIAATASSWPDTNDAMTLGFFDAIWSDPGLKINFKVEVQPSHNDIYSMGDVLNQGLIYMKKACSSASKYDFEIYHYFGDPSMEIYTARPSRFGNVIVKQDGQSITVNTNTPDCKITICSKEDNGQSYFRAANGVSSYTFSNVNVPCTICVTKHNYIPYFFNGDVYVQNKNITNKQIYVGKNVSVGNNVTTTQSTGPVVVTGEGQLIIDAEGTVILDEGFDCEVGASLDVK